MHNVEFCRKFSDERVRVLVPKTPDGWVVRKASDGSSMPVVSCLQLLEAVPDGDTIIGTVPSASVATTDWVVVKSADNVICDNYNGSVVCEFTLDGSVVASRVDTSQYRD